ncbi:MAG: hypothetical protein KF725_03105 [Cyclobacteriaceae bacterium]|nr:hypothetical protein [Cyclobacteriaceae bacterium]UYN86578.1 MAG: hypothetical protein KIT51_17230 [Cyclobacteriaceae bacterium]
MTTKLTLSVNAKLAAKAKRYAKKRGTSISKLFEEHISSIHESPEAKERKIMLENLRKFKGIARGVSKDLNYKDLIADYILEKHLK